jgi:hypothetical protein
MDTKQIIAELDTEIARLQEVKSILSAGTPTPAKTNRGHNKAKTTPIRITAKKRSMSPEGRARIAAAQKARWAKAKKAAKAA